MENNNSKKIIWIIALIAIIVLIGVICFGYFRKLTYNPENPVATIEVEGFGTIKVELYPKQAPETVSNFIALANNEFYDGTKFHRIIEDFMIQAGSKNGDGSTGPKISDLRELKEDEKDSEYTIKGEFISNGISNTLRFEEGTIAMAREDFTRYGSNLLKQSYDSASSQFFIMTDDNHSYLNGYYTPFGKVTEGMDVVKQIAAVEVTVAEGKEEVEGAEESTPVDPPVVKSIRVDTHGVDYGLPETLEPFDLTSWWYKHSGMNQ